MFNIRNNKRRKYNSLRLPENRFAFCKAPFTSMRIHRNGSVQICCHHLDYMYLDGKSLKDIWFGEEMNQIRRKMTDFDVPKSCGFCKYGYDSESFKNINALSFDHQEINDSGYPSYIDFSLSNTCNLFCLMCDSTLSSAIGNHTNSKKSDILFGEKFIEEIKEFIPHLKGTVFTGGEPFLINVYYQIWDLIAILNPNTVISITTNGSICNDKVKLVLDKGIFNIMVSLDSFDKEVYSSIRRGADFESVINNISYFSNYCKQKGTKFSITICPMQNNWEGIPEILKKCNAENWFFSFNTVIKPWELALWSLPAVELQAIIIYLNSFVDIDTENIITQTNLNTYSNLIQLLKSWLIRINHYEMNKPDEIYIKKTKGLIAENLLNKVSSEISIDSQLKSKVFGAVNKLPNMLIKESFINYLNASKPEMILRELVDNDLDTLHEHLTIVLFNMD